MALGCHFWQHPWGEWTEMLCCPPGRGKELALLPVVILGLQSWIWHGDELLGGGSWAVLTWCPVPPGPAQAAGGGEH